MDGLQGFLKDNAVTAEQILKVTQLLIGHSTEVQVRVHLVLGVLAIEAGSCVGFGCLCCCGGVCGGLVLWVGVKGVAGVLCACCEP